MWSEREGGDLVLVSPAGVSLTFVGVEENYCPTIDLAAFYMPGTTFFFFLFPPLSFTLSRSCNFSTKELRSSGSNKAVRNLQGGERWARDLGIRSGIASSKAAGNVLLC